MATAPERAVERRWLLLIHQLPPKPDYFRVKIGRRLGRVGAVALKNSVYVLPATAQAMEDLQWILREIVDGGGDASICRSTFVDGITDDEIERLFHDARARSYATIAADAREALRSLRPGRPPSAEQRSAMEQSLAKLRKRAADVARIDFFDSPARVDVVAKLDAIEERLRRSAAPDAASPVSRSPAEYRGRTWVTRRAIFVDRIASAWLIRRFIDPEARFRFVAPDGYRPAAGELRFDMFDAEFTHEGDRCTFETLLRRFGLDDPALADLAEVVHAIDLRDGKFDRDDAAGIERVLAGIAASASNDSDRLEQGARLFDGLYALKREEMDRTAPTARGRR